ncbi:hypothetical protein [uncultured Pseudomonas sp.]|nr:hypothetical protein [uncultured Pseudomonas sp.]
MSKHEEAVTASLQTQNEVLFRRVTELERQMKAVIRLLTDFGTHDDMAHMAYRLLKDRD